MFLKVHKVLLGLLFLAAFSPTTAYADDEIRIDLPAGGQLKVRNDFGNISAEVWSNTQVAVSAVIGGDGSFTRSPIIIDNRGSLLTISVVRRPIDPIVPIHLKIKVPENADITARSVKGTINSSLSGTPTIETPPFQTRIGHGGRKIDIQTDSGEILLMYAQVSDVANNPSTPLSSSPPELIGGDNPKRPAGTPADSTVGGDLDEGDVIRVDSQLVTLKNQVFFMCAHH